MENQTESEKLFESLLEIVSKLGWVVAFPKSDDPEAEVPGMVIGTEQYVTDVLNGKYSDES